MDPDKDGGGRPPDEPRPPRLNGPPRRPCTRTALTLLRRHGVEIKGAGSCTADAAPPTAARAAAADPAQRERDRAQRHTGTPDPSAHLRRTYLIVAADSAHLSARGRQAARPSGRRRPHSAEGKIVGDVHPGVGRVAGWVAPNPGGVGPITRAQLLVRGRAAAASVG
ncbi:Bifunctional protein FolD OS=Streptomyces tendae OX=1932 GN=folD PE=3 SV=1 [Streptomyces tendae]